MKFIDRKPLCAMRIGELLAHIGFPVLEGGNDSLCSRDYFLEMS